MKLIDSHCHFDFEPFDGHRDSLWLDCQQKGISHLIVPGVDPRLSAKQFAIVSEFESIYGAAGLHPWWVSDYLKQKGLDQSLQGTLLNYTQHKKCVAVGECGLDGLINCSIEDQTVYFKRQLAIACDCQLPLIIHVRKAHNETLQLLKQFKPAKGGVIHAFSGSLALAKSYWDLGFYLGIGGTITYERATKTRNAIAQMPLESLLLETDAPDMPLNGQQGQANSPLNLPKVASSLATLRQENLDEVARITTLNSLILFNLS